MKRVAVSCWCVCDQRGWTFAVATFATSYKIYVLLFTVMLATGKKKNTANARGEQLLRFVFQSTAVYNYYSVQYISYKI
jgi:hypothetical protein